MLYFKAKVDEMATYNDLLKIEEVYCKLFSDTVTDKICRLRKQELNGRGGFSCTECRANTNSLEPPYNGKS